MNYVTDTNFHYELLELLARRMRPELYVEFGVDCGNSIRRVAPYCRRAIGVDVNRPEDSTGFEFFHGTTSEFATESLSELEGVELAFIDADHGHEPSLCDFELILPHIVEDGVILLHDTYPENSSWADVRHCGDCYRTSEHIYQRCHDYGVEVMTLPTPPGLTLVRRRSRPLRWLDAPD